MPLLQGHASLPFLPLNVAPQHCIISLGRHIINYKFCANFIFSVLPIEKRGGVIYILFSPAI